MSCNERQSAVFRIRRGVTMAVRTGRSGDGASSSRRRGLGVRERDGRDYFEVRAGDETNRNYKIYVSGFVGNKELLKMSIDAVELCNLGEAAYLALGHTKLHYPEERRFLADFFRQDNRMVGLASLHRSMRAAGEPWTKEMKKTLRELAADALKSINHTAQGAPAPQPVDSQMREVASDAVPVIHYTVLEATAALPVRSQNINGSDAAAVLHVAGSVGRELGAGQDNWHNTREVSSDALRPINDTTQGAAAAQPVDTQMREVASDAVQNCTAQGAAAAQPSDSRNIIDGYGDEGSHFDIDGAIGPEDGAAPERWPQKKEALRSTLSEWPELPREDLLEYFLKEIARLEAENRKLRVVCCENALEISELKAENSELKALRGEKGSFGSED